MPGFRCGERGLDRLVVAHLTDTNNVGILPQSMDERMVKGTHIGQHLLLHHDGPTVFMNSFDGIFNGQDLAAPLSIDEVDHVVHGRGLARSGGARDQDEPVGLTSQFIDARWKAKFLASRKELSTEPATQLGDPIAPVERDPDPTGHRVADGNTQFPELIELLPLQVGQERLGHDFALLGRYGIFIGQENFAGHPKGGRNSDDHMQIGGTHRHGFDEQSIHPGMNGVGDMRVHGLRNRRKTPVHRSRKPGRSERLKPSLAARESGWICQA